MIDLEKWIYSKDIAAWIEKKVPLNLEDQMECICAAPHRTLEEKLLGVMELKSECGDKKLDEKIEMLTAALERSRSDVIMWSYLFGIEIFYQGEKDCFLPNLLFRTAKKAEDEICRRIERAAAEEGLGKNNWYGIVKVFQKASQQCFIHTENFIVRYDSEVIFVQEAPNHEGWYRFSEVGMTELQYLKIPYPSGTIVSVEENPFLPPLKGVLVNETEPDEENFSVESYNQWLIYPTLSHLNQTHGIGIVNLRNEDVPFGSQSDLIFPYKQYIEIYKGKLKEKDVWLSEFSEMVKADKNCLRKILCDREPKSDGDIDWNEERINYIKKLAGNASGNHRNV